MNIFKTIGTLFTKARKSFARSSMGGRQKSDYERYLDQSTDVHDLEARERAWNSKMQHRNRH